MDTKLFSRRQEGGMFSILNREQFPSGNIWWVDSSNTTDGSNTTGYGANPDAPFLTWAYAESAASADDTIFLMPGHSETIGATGAAAITIDTAGLRTIGLGGRTRRPQFLIDGFNDTYVLLSGADTTTDTITFTSGHANIEQGVSVTAAGVMIRNCSFLENTGSENFLVAIQTTAAADDLLVEDCMFYGVTQATECIELVGATDRVTIRNNYINGKYSVAAIAAITNACLGLEIYNNRIFNFTTAGNDLAGAVDLVASSTGTVTRNLIHLGDDTDILTSIDAANCLQADNWGTNEYDQEAGVAGTRST